MKMIRKNRILVAMAIWLLIVGSFACWFELDTSHQEKHLAMSIAKSFSQQIIVSLQWNMLHDGVYVPVTSKTPPNPNLSEQIRVLTTDNSIKLARINPAYMIRQMADLAESNEGNIRFHLKSLKPIRPDNKAADWEEAFLQSFKQGVKEQGEFHKDGQTTWFRYMAPLSFDPHCLKCHEQRDVNRDDFQDGISVEIPYITHTHFHLFIHYGSVAVIGLICIFMGGRFYERKQRLFEATFNSPIPICITDKEFTILIANESYWAEFGPLPEGKKKIKCFEHRLGKSCHTENCPLTQVMGGSSKYICEPTKEKGGVCKHFIVTAKPLLDSRGRVEGVIESFQEITKRKQLESEKEHLIDELKNSLAQVKLLSGLIPICASCKKIRDDQGFWSQVESYVSKHSEARFSHGICPDCVRKLYPDICDKILESVDTQTT